MILRAMMSGSAAWIRCAVTLGVIHPAALARSQMCSAKAVLPIPDSPVIRTALATRCVRTFSSTDSHCCISASRPTNMPTFLCFALRGRIPTKAIQEFGGRTTLRSVSEMTLRVFQKCSFPSAGLDAGLGRLLSESIAAKTGIPKSMRRVLRSGSSPRSNDCPSAPRVAATARSWIAVFKGSLSCTSLPAAIVARVAVSPSLGVALVVKIAHGFEDFRDREIGTSSFDFKRSIVFRNHVFVRMVFASEK